MDLSSDVSINSINSMASIGTDNKGSNITGIVFICIGIIAVVIILIVCLKKKESTTRTTKNPVITPIISSRSPQPISTPNQQLTADSFHLRFLQNGEHGVVLFYGEFCGICRSIKSIIDETMARVPNFYQFNYPDSQPFLKDLQVEGFPTVLKFANGKVIATHSGPRTVDAFIAFAS